MDLFWFKGMQLNKKMKKMNLYSTPSINFYSPIPKMRNFKNDSPISNLVFLFKNEKFQDECGEEPKEEFNHSIKIFN